MKKKMHKKLVILLGISLILFGRIAYAAPYSVKTAVMRLHFDLRHTSATNHNSDHATHTYSSSAAVGANLGWWADGKPNSNPNGSFVNICSGGGAIYIGVGQTQRRTYSITPYPYDMVVGRAYCINNYGSFTVTGDIDL